MDETQRRVAELATVNSVGQALAAHLELDALIELVGERVRETFDADIAYVALHDEPFGRIDFPYYYESGERQTQPSFTYGEGITSRILQSREPLCINQSLDDQEIAYIGTPSRSYLGVPIAVGDKAIGVISVQSTEAGGPVRRGRRAPPLHDRRQRGRRDPERAAVRGDPASRRRDGRAGRGRARALDRPPTSPPCSTVSPSGPRTCSRPRPAPSTWRSRSPETFRAAVALGENAEEIMADRILEGEGIIGDLAARGEAEVVNDASRIRVRSRFPARRRRRRSGSWSRRCSLATR